MFPPMSPQGERVRAAIEQREREQQATRAQTGQRSLLRRLSARLQGWSAPLNREEVQAANQQTDPGLTENVSA